MSSKNIFFEDRVKFCWISDTGDNLDVFEQKSQIFDWPLNVVQNCVAKTQTDRMISWNFQFYEIVKNCAIFDTSDLMDSPNTEIQKASKRDPFLTKARSKISTNKHVHIKIIKFHQIFMNFINLHRKLKDLWSYVKQQYLGFLNPRRDFFNDQFCKKWIIFTLKWIQMNQVLTKNSPERTIF